MKVRRNDPPPQPPCTIDLLGLTPRQYAIVEASLNMANYKVACDGIQAMRDMSSEYDGVLRDATVQDVHDLYFELPSRIEFIYNGDEED